MAAVVHGTVGGGMSDPHIPVEVRVMLRLARELSKACLAVLAMHATPYSSYSMVSHCMAGYYPYHARNTVHIALYSTV